MTVANFLSLALGLIFSTGLIAAPDAACDCETALDPTFTWSLNHETCVVTFTADPGDPCINVKEYGWAINGGASSSSGTNPVYHYENISSIDHVSLKVIATGDDFTECSETYSEAINDVTCNSLLEFNVTKEAYRNPPGNDPINTVYTSQPFQWRITITNDVQDRELVYCDIFPEGTLPGNPDCAFTILSVNVEWDGMPGVPYPGITIDVTNPADISGTMVLPIGTITITFMVKACIDGNYAGQEFQNCFKFEAFPPPPDLGLVPQLVCDELTLLFGCPITMTDGFCLLPEDILAGETLSSRFSGHTRFLDIVKIEGDLAYDMTKVAAPYFELANLIDPIAGVVTEDMGNGQIHFVIETLPGTSFDIDSPGAGGTWNPFSIHAVLLEDLLGCTVFYVDNLSMTNSVGLNRSIYIDPGTFCQYYTSENYESAHIVGEEEEDCVGADPFTLTVIGPFETQNPLTTYAWSTSDTTQSIDITSGGYYEVEITDSEGCRRFASITVEDCEPDDCDCDVIQPEISFIHNADCSVSATASFPNCNSLTYLKYTWKFSNGVIYVGQFPPPQMLPLSDGPEIKLEIASVLNGAKCVKYLEQDLYPCNTLDGGLDLLIYPNPSNNNTIAISIEGTNNPNGIVQILNTYGTPLMNKVANDSQLTFNVSSLRPGLYLVKFVAKETGQVSLKHLIIE